MKNKIYQFKSITNKGEPCKHIFEVMNDGSVGVNQFILSKDNNIRGFDPITKRFGKTLHRIAIGFKFDSLEKIYLTAKNQITL